MEDAIVQKTIGIVTKDEYKRRREEVEAQAAADQVRKTLPIESSGAQDKAKQKKKAKKARPSTLSFGSELEDEEQGISPTMDNKKMGKCSNVDVSFLPKNSQEAEQAALDQERSMREYRLKQEKAKGEELTLNYTFRSGLTQRELPHGAHKATITVTKGHSAEDVARLVREDVEKLGPAFVIPQIAGVRSERELMLVANTSAVSFIIPGNCTLVELCAKQWAEGASLFDDLKPGIVVSERRAYEALRHTFPYSQWEPLDMRKVYSHKEMLAGRDSRKIHADPVHRDNCINKVSREVPL